MDRGTAALLTAGIGGCIALQAPINAGLGRTIGSAQAAFFSFLVGTVLLCAIAALSKGGLGRIGDAGAVPAWYYLTGGLLGAAYVSTVLVTVRTLGAGPVVGATVTGQLTASLIVDQFGLLGVDKSPITFAKAVGVVLLGVGTLLIVRE